MALWCRRRFSHARALRFFALLAKGVAARVGSMQTAWRATHSALASYFPPPASLASEGRRFRCGFDAAVRLRVCE
eukprot:10335554-Alexandrium_andersonii.AAC.1